MKNWLLAVSMLLIVFSSCKDTSPPVFSQIKVNGIDVGIGDPIINANITETATFQITMRDDEDLFQFITYIDTTGQDDKERLNAYAVSGTEDFVEFSWPMTYIDSLSQLYYFGLPVPILFTVQDNNTNTETITVTFNIN